MTIVTLSPEGWESYRAIRLEALQNEPEAFASNYARMMDRPSSFWITRLEDSASDTRKLLLFAEEDGELLGLVGAYPDEQPGITNVISMYVRPQSRRKGVGRALLAAIVECLSELPAPHEIRLAVNQSQQAAVNLYSSFGFQKVGEEVLVKGSGEDYVQLTMALPAASKAAR
jgi:ribosomal protein S18 acetylase RimI-like enzyme